MKELLKVRCKVYIAAVFSLCVGKWEKIAGVDCYISTPSGDYAKETVLLFLTDAFGPQLPNNQVCLSLPMLAIVS